MSFIQVTADELHQIASQLNATAGSIASENSSALSLVNGLVGQGWKGAASSQFDALFTQWKQSADKLLESLNGISTLLDNAGTAYADTEAQIAKSMG